MFDWFSLDYIYYPVSGIMWLWYKLFAILLGPNNFFAWALSVMFLVFTLRALLYKPFVRQIRTTRQMQELQPQIKALQKKYGKDRQRMALEMQKLQREHGFNPILGCLPMLAQIPVFLGLYHVLMSFNRTQTGIGRLGLSVEENRSLGNYVFSVADVGHCCTSRSFDRFAPPARCRNYNPRSKPCRRSTARTASGWRWRCRNFSANTASTRSLAACRCSRKSRCSWGCTTS